MMRSRIFLAFALSVLFVTGCATTEPTSVWKDPSYTGPSLKRLLVIGVSPDNLARREYEDTFVSELAKGAIAAEPSYRLIPDSGKLNRERVIDAIEGENFDGVLVTHLLGVDEKEVYVSGGYRPYHGSYHGHYSSVYDRVYEPGYYHRYQIVRLETNLYETQQERQIWGMQSETVDPGSVTKLTKSLVAAATERLREDGLIRP